MDRTTEPRFRVGDDWRHPIAMHVPFAPFDLVGTLQGIVQSLDQRRDTRRGIETLIGIGLAGQIRVSRDLPATQIDRLESGLDHLDGLGAGERAEGVNVFIPIQQFPQPLRAVARHRVLDPQ